MSVSMKNVDVAFQGVGQKAGMDIWRIEDFRPVLVPKSSHGKFYSGDSYVVLRTTALKSGAYHYDIHFWLGKDTSQDEAGVAAIKTIELDAALGGRAVQFRETQGHETQKFLSYFKPCIIPMESGIASGFKKVEVAQYEPRLFVVRGKRTVRVRQVPFARSSLNHDDIFVLDTKSKIFQFNGGNSSIQERGKALAVVQYIKDTDHEGSCDVAVIDDGNLGSEANAGEFWVLFGGFAPLTKKVDKDDDILVETAPGKLYCVVEGKATAVDNAASLRRDMLDKSKCYLLDCGSELFVWAGRNTSIDMRKAANSAVEELVKRPKHTLLTRVIEGFETLAFRSNFDEWPLSSVTPVSEDGRGKVAALLKQQGVNVKGLLKGVPVKEEVVPLLNATGKLEIWRVNGNAKTAIPAADFGKFYDNSCYIVLYTYQGNTRDRKEEYLLCYWLGRQSTVEDKETAASLTNEMLLSFKGRPVMAQIIQGKEPPQFLALFQCMTILKGGKSSGVKEDTVILLRVRGTSPQNTQALQVEPVAASLNSADCFVLQTGTKFFTWSGNLSNAEEQKLAVQVTQFLKPGTTARPLKEGLEPLFFWSTLGGKQSYPSQRKAKDVGKDPRLFVCSPSKGTLKVTEVFNFSQEDLLSEDVMILDCHSAVFVWVGQHASTHDKQHASDLAQKYIERAAALEGLSKDTPFFKVMEANEPSFFTCYFSWDPSKATMHGDMYDRKLAALKGQPASSAENYKRRLTPNTLFGHEENVSSQRAAAMAALSPVLWSGGDTLRGSPKPKGTPIHAPLRPSSPRAPATHIAGFVRVHSSFSQRTAANAALSPVRSTSTDTVPSTLADGDWVALTSPIMNVEALGDTEMLSKSTSTTSDGEVEEKGVSSGIFSYERLKVETTDPPPGIDPTRREAYLSSEEFEKLFGMTTNQFYKMPKWKQELRKIALDLF